MEPEVTVPIVAAADGTCMPVKQAPRPVAPVSMDLIVKIETMEAGRVRTRSFAMKKAVKPINSIEVQNGRTHTDLFAQAVKVFQQGDFQQAAALFQQAAAGPVPGVNESAHMYMRMCQQRMSQLTVELQTPEDYYNNAVGLINARKYREARESLEAAVAAGPQPHFCYALALVEGHLGFMDVAASHLRHAIQMDPTLRGLARGDPDFATLLHNPRMKEAMGAEQGTGG